MRGDEDHSLDINYLKCFIELAIEVRLTPSLKVMHSGLVSF